MFDRFPDGRFRCDPAHLRITCRADEVPSRAEVARIGSADKAECIRGVNIVAYSRSEQHRSSLVAARR